MVVVAPGVAAAHHQHLFCVRLDLDVDGGPNSVYEVDVVPAGGGDDDPWGNGIEVRATLLASEAQAQRDVDPARSRAWKVVNPGSRNAVGQPVGYKLLPAPTPTLLAGPGSVVRKRAGFATHNLWVTPYDPAETRAAGPYPNQHTGGGGLPAWTAADRPLVDTDVVLWHSFGLTHVVRPEDWPVMPVERTGFWLIPVGFFDRNPALDIPPPHCPPDVRLHLPRYASNQNASADLVGADGAHGQVDGRPEGAGDGVEDERGQARRWPGRRPGGRRAGSG